MISPCLSEPELWYGMTETCCSGPCRMRLANVRNSAGASLSTQRFQHMSALQITTLYPVPRSARLLKHSGAQRKVLSFCYSDSANLVGWGAWAPDFRCLNHEKNRLRTSARSLPKGKIPTAHFVGGMYAAVYM